MPATAEIETRRLGEQERLFHYLHSYGGMIAVQVLHLEGPLDVERLRAGLDHVQRRHPLLAAHIRYGEGVFRSRPPFYYKQPWFVREGTAPIPLRIVTDPNPDTWRGVLETELATPLATGNTPRLRATLVHAGADATTHQLFLTADHAVADAQATNMVSRDLLDYLADPAGASTQPVPATTLPEPLEARLPAPTGPEGPYQMAIRIPARTGKAPMTARLVRDRLSPEETARLHAAIRANRTTMHGVVSAAVHLAYRDKYGLDQMTQISTVDLRRMCKPAFPASTFGCYIDLVRTLHRIDGGLWDVARDVAFRLITALARDRQTASMMKLPPLAVYTKETVPTMTHRRRIDGLGITTAGESGLVRNYGDLTLTDVTMMVSTVMFGPALFVITAERMGALDLYAGYAEDALEDREANDILARVMTTLRSAA